jgi:allophanate hydrolase subunit 2
LLAQMGPGDSFGFEVIPLDQAQALDAQRTKAFAALAEKLAPVRAYILQHYP